MKVCIVSGTRAEYGLLKPLIEKILKSSTLTLQLLVTGTHLSPEFGLTCQHIESDGFVIDEKVEMLLSSDTATGIVKSMGLGMIGYADAFRRLNPDIIVLLGDRYEMLAVASAAVIFKIPIIHINGGDITEGAYDDAIRHAITKLSSIHFTSTEQYRKRVIQMGEDPNLTFNVGAIGLDNIKSLSLLSKETLENDLNIKFKKYNYQVTFHPETLDVRSSREQFEILLKAIDKQEDSFFIFTKANADTDGRVINQMIDEYVKNNPDKSSAYFSLGSLRFLSVLKLCDAIVGNSSSGIVEAPALGIATINIGNRQKGRIQAQSIVNTIVEEQEISNAFELVKSQVFKKKINEVINPYGVGDTSDRILSFLENLTIAELGVKVFYDRD